jgi:prolyl oligopeptidase
MGAQRTDVPLSGERVGLVALSDGGEDAIIQREFNLKTGTFVQGGFVLPRSKQQVAWFDKDTLLVASDWGSGTMTHSGYPFVVKLWKARPAAQSSQRDLSRQRDGRYR